MQTKRILVRPLSPKTFFPFGQAIMGAKGKPNYKGNGWTSLFPAGDAKLPRPEIGWVITQQPKEGLTITGMERHPDSEIIWTVDVPLVQAVASPGNLNDHSEQPDPERVEAFLIEPGQVIVFHPGTWHSPAFPAWRGKALYYFIGTDHPREPGWEDIPWIPLKGNVPIRLEVQK